MRTILGVKGWDLSEFAISANAILGIRDSGKTYTATKAAEELYDAGVPFIAFDPIGVWHSLRVPGKGQGYPVVVAGGKQADLPLTRKNAGDIVRAAMSAEVSLVLDLFSIELSKSDWRSIVRESVEILLHENSEHGLRHIFIEEAAEFCLPDDTEVLTPDGWASPYTLKEGILVAAFDPATGTYQFEPVSRVIWRDHDGPMVPLKTARLDALVTPDHRVVMKRWQHDSKRYRVYDWAFTQAHSLPAAFMIPSGGAPCGTGIPELTEISCRMLGWIITDGWRHGTKRRNREYLCLEQSASTRKRGIPIAAEMEKALAALGIKAKCRQRTGGTIGNRAVRPTDVSYTWFLGAALSKELLRWFDIDIHRIPRRILRDGSKEQLQALYQGLMEGDGTAEGDRWRYFYAGKNRGLADDFQELALRLGVRTINRLVPQNGQWRVSIGGDADHFVRRRPPVPYQGKVWDITVPSGAFLARRNGTVFATGNCPQRVVDGLVFAAVEKLVRMGGNSKLGCTLINQRSADLNKSVLELCANVFVHRQTGKNTLGDLRKWFDMLALDKGEQEKIADSLPDLKSGECWAFINDLKKPVRLKIPEKNSQHPDRRAVTAKGETKRQAVPATAFVEQMRSRLAEKDKPKPASAPTSKTVAKINTLDQKGMDKLIAAARAEGFAEGWAQGWPAGHARGCKDQMKELGELALAFTPSAPAAPRSPSKGPSSPIIALSSLTKPRAAASPGATAGLPAPQRKVLASVGFWHSVGTDAPTRAQVGGVAGYSPSSGGFNNLLGALNTAGLITIPAAGRIALAPGAPFDPLTAEEARAKVYSVLSNPQRKLVDALVEHDGGPITRDDLGAATDYSPSSGGFNNLIGSLCTLTIFEKPNAGQVALSDWAKEVLA